MAAILSGGDELTLDKDDISGKIVHYLIVSACNEAWSDIFVDIFFFHFLCSFYFHQTVASLTLAKNTWGSTTEVDRGIHVVAGTRLPRKINLWMGLQQMRKTFAVYQLARWPNMDYIAM